MMVLLTIGGFVLTDNISSNVDDTVAMVTVTASIFISNQSTWPESLTAGCSPLHHG